MQIVTIPPETLFFFALSASETDDSIERLFPTLEDLVRRFAARKNNNIEVLAKYQAGITAKELVLADLTSHVSAKQHGYGFTRLNNRDETSGWFKSVATQLVDSEGGRVGLDGTIIRSDGLTSSWTQINVTTQAFSGDAGVGVLEYSVDSPAIKRISMSLVEDSGLL